MHKFVRVLARPRFWIWLHGTNTCFWLAATVVVLRTSLAESVAYVALVSNLSLAFAEAGAWQAARAEASNPSAEEIAIEVVKLLRQQDEG